jgi:hypothetical protein
MLILTVVRDEERSVWQMKPEREQKAETKRSRWGFRGMTVRDWLPIVGALLIPVVIAAGTWGITWQQGKIEDRRAKAERELAEQRAWDEALQAYLDQMSTLLLEEKLRDSKPDSEARTLARARTLAVLGSLEGDPQLSQKSFLEVPPRKKTVVEFLYEASLINTEHPVIPLNQADLNHAALFHSDLSGVNLSGAFLNDAWVASSNLENADLSDAGLNGVKINGTDLSGANLEAAYLVGATGWTEQQLTAAESLKGATMPNGQKYEDWLKDREGNGDDE